MSMNIRDLNTFKKENDEKKRQEQKAPGVQGNACFDFRGFRSIKVGYGMAEAPGIVSF